MNDNPEMNQNPHTENTNLSEDNGGVQGTKMFSQEDVNNIIQSRLDKLKKQAASEQETKYSEKIKELEARESALLMKEGLASRGLPEEIANIITCKDKEDMNAKLDTLKGVLDKAVNNALQRVQSTHTYYNPAGGRDVDVGKPDFIRECMGMNYQK